jgi:hypothetical protein
MSLAAPDTLEKESLSDEACARQRHWIEKSWRFLEQAHAQRKKKKSRGTFKRYHVIDEITFDDYV